MLNNFTPFTSRQIIDIEGLRRLGQSPHRMAINLGLCDRRIRKFVRHMESPKDLRCEDLGIKKVTRMIFDSDPNNTNGTFDVVYKPVSVARVSILDGRAS